MAYKNVILPPEKSSFRVYFFAGIIGLGFFILILRLVYLQIVQGERYKLLAKNNSVRLIASRPPRGLIFDRNGNVLVSNVPSFDVSLIPVNIKNMDESINSLSKLLDLDPEEIYEKVIYQSGWVYLPVVLKENVNRRIIAGIEERKAELPGVLVQTEPKRYYRYGDMAAHVLGYTSRITESQMDDLRSEGYTPLDYVGQMGIEKAYESFLRGESGGYEIEVDHKGRPQSKSLVNLPTREPRPGNNLILTLDVDLQELSENLLRGYKGCVVVMNPQNGEILVMASQPSFDLNLFSEGFSYADWKRFSEDPAAPLNDRAINGLYPPGSIFKIITASAGLEEKVIDDKSVFDCNGSFWIKTWLYRCWYRLGHHTCNIYKAIAQSCDIFFYKLGLKLKVKRLNQYATAFGLGQPTDIDIGAESVGFVPSAEWKERTENMPWFPGNTVLFSIGQGYVLATPLQVAGIINAVAMDGLVYKPHFLKEVRTPGGRIIYRSKPEVLRKLNLSKTTLDIVREGLYEVINGYGGTGWRARIRGFPMCGKTGTSENPHGRPHAWFTAFGPRENPEISVTILIENGEEGGVTAAPMAKQIIELYLQKKKGLYKKENPEAAAVATPAVVPEKPVLRKKYHP